MDFRERANQWLASNRVSESDKSFIRSCNDEELEDMFGADLEFGTAGLRGELGPGTNRINILVVRRATIGLARFILDKYGEEGKRRGVAVSFDNRHGSYKFSAAVCDILNTYGIDTYCFACPHPTPELSYTVRKLHCVAGVMITASHNPAKYNGYKVYDETGDQMVYENIDALVKEINSLPDVLSIRIEPAIIRGTNTILGENFDSEFIDREVSTSILNEGGISPKHVKIVLTPMCGTNVFLGPWSLRDCGYTVSSVPGQDSWDADFDDVPFPNPEFDCAWVKAEKHLMEMHEKDPAYTVAICNDPDADRVGLGFIGRDGKFHRYTGNQTGALLIDFLLGERKKQGTLPPDGVVYNSFVTSAFGATIAERKYGMKVRWVPTGFKYIGYAIEHSCEPFVFGYEESYGYLTKEFVRDKDCLQSNIAIADMAEDCYRKGITIDERFAQLEAEFGHFVTSLRNIEVDGLVGKRKLTERLNDIRHNPIGNIAGQQVVRVDDYLESVRVSPVENRTERIDDIPSLDCIKYFFSNGWLAVRPSGTEPKCKVYCEMVAPSDEDGKRLADSVIDDFCRYLNIDEI